MSTALIFLRIAFTPVGAMKVDRTVDGSPRWYGGGCGRQSGDKDGTVRIGRERETILSNDEGNKRERENCRVQPRAWNWKRPVESGSLQECRNGTLKG